MSYELNEYHEEIFGEEFEDDEEPLCCVRCSCIIGEEVGYADNFGDGPICDNCLPDKETNETP